MEEQYRQMISQYNDFHCVGPQPKDDAVQTSIAKEQPEAHRTDEEVPLLIALEDESYPIDQEFEWLE